MYYWYDSSSNSFILNEIKNSSYIPQIIWVITDKCNYKCPFCFQPKNDTDIDLNLFDSYISVCDKLGVQKIDISGGEPLSFQKLPFVIEQLKLNGFHLTISTNGSGLISNQKWIASNSNYFSRIIVSLNGFNEKYNDYLCGVNGAYDRLTKFLDLLKQNECKNIRINTVITSTYLNDNNVKELVNIIKNINPYEWCLIQPHPENKKPLFDQFSITIEQFNNIVIKIKELLLDKNIHIISRNIDNYSGYWVLNPDGRFFLHTDGVRESISTNFSISSVPEIINLSKKHGLWVPQN